MRASHDRGVQYLSIRYTERLAEADTEPSVSSVGDSYDNALAETIIGLFKAEVIRRNGPWKNLDEVGGSSARSEIIPPAEFEAMYYEAQEGPAKEAGLN